MSFLQFLLIRSTICTGIRGLCNCVQACTEEDEKFGHLGCITTSPGLTRSRGQSILLEPGKWFAFLNKSPQRGRDGTHENEVGTLRREGAAKIVMSRPVASIPSKRMNVFYYCYYYGLVILSKRKWPCTSRRSNFRSCRLFCFCWAFIS